MSWGASFTGSMLSTSEFRLVEFLLFVYLGTNAIPSCGQGLLLEKGLGGVPPGGGCGGCNPVRLHASELCPGPTTFFLTDHQLL